MKLLMQLDGQRGKGHRDRGGKRGYLEFNYGCEEEGGVQGRTLHTTDETAHGEKTGNGCAQWR